MGSAADRKMYLFVDSGHKYGQHVNSADGWSQVAGDTLDVVEELAASEGLDDRDPEHCDHCQNYDESPKQFTIRPAFFTCIFLHPQCFYLATWAVLVRKERSLCFVPGFKSRVCWVFVSLCFVLELKHA